MSLSSLYLDAFAEVSRQKSFSLAAKKLHVTQSALSQRILNLEAEIGSTLFIRESSGLRLTELGQRLLRYCQSKETLESEFLSTMQPGNTKSLHGIMRIAGFSTVMRSVLLPIAAELVKEHPHIQWDLKSGELRELPVMLTSGVTDFILTNQPMEKQGLENHLLGYEENVLVQAASGTARQNLYLDHDADDTTTYDFFKAQGKKVPVFQRGYLDEIYALIDGVKRGMGRAVIPMHLCDRKHLHVVKGYKPVLVPVYLSYYSQAFYTDLHKVLIERLRRDVPLKLAH